MYAGVPKDYTNYEVNPDYFLYALKGDEKRAPKGKKVIKSGPKDNIFVYFTDHGAGHFIAFPETEIYSYELMAATKEMHEKKKFNKLVYYVEV